jgi:uncharacterized surface protein with fasciclin (FAS1) repeats
MNKEVLKKVSIYDRVEGTATLSVLLEIIESADLFEALDDEGPFTLFAPCDSAFNRQSQDFVDELLEPENLEDLIALLDIHLIPEKIPLITNESKKLITLDGSTTEITSDGINLFYEGAKIIEKGIECSNGVIHIIDEVIIPEIMA